MRPTDLLTAAQLGARLALSPRTIQNLRYQGKIPFVALSLRAIRFREEDVVAALVAGAEERHRTRARRAKFGSQPK